ncbi:hypothetical protein M409DRAFT_50373 [Zasmidium cellare ATCC 36951]|uniref:NAD dependent epimerase/dehydratase n=1 Tax=Zasmidium cellare ATCC 36951 TaxID=1080233 RepID=A0A6A6CXF1_ZASCE|nr:uncharacterized protein M409DRAFT_50373 [Zasmidium cellare ATCC 36951]KAF2171715.1 hypothetical protein M409DRAFT_50373 [Zasmidium cellare ATCC 36951]
MASAGRFVDTVPAPEQATTVEVLVLGLSRTGTTSMSHALPKLGYKSYHMSEACINARKGHGSLIMWNEAITAKYGPSPSSPSSSTTTKTLHPYGPAEFAKLLHTYTATADAPTVLFAPELMAAYPNAKLILTTQPRGVDAWLRSVRNSYYRVANWVVLEKILMPYDKAFTQPYVTLLRRIMEIWCGNEPFAVARDFDAMQDRLRRTYLEHNAEILAAAKAQGREVLEFDPRKGWEPLCGFLGKQVPEGRYPHVNEGEYVVNLHRYMVLRRLWNTFGRGVGLGLGAVGVVVGAWWWLRR